VLGELEPVILKFLPCVDGAEDLAPDLLRRLHLARDLVGPVVRNVAVRTAGADARAVREVRGVLQFLEHVVAHFVARRAEFFGIGDFERGIERAPEHDAANEAAERQEAEAQMRAGAAGDTPEPDEQLLEPLHCRAHFFGGSTSSMSLNVLGTSGCASVCWTWHAVQKNRRGVTSASTCPSRSMKWVTLIIGAPEPSVNCRR
jgi:hypothetical protein